MRVLTAEQMREYDRIGIEEYGIPGVVLMENAGRAVAVAALEMISDAARPRVAVLAGAGNNGGDGCVVARHLYNRGVTVTVYLAADEARIKGDARTNLDVARRMGVPVVAVADPEALRGRSEEIRGADLVVDALLGTGATGEVKDLLRQAIELINSVPAPVLAVDIPSGLSSDTGRPLGVCVIAARTVTFGYPKLGQVIHPGVEFCGEMTVADISLPLEIEKRVPPFANLVEEAEVVAALPGRDPSAHKGRFGHLLVIAGSPGKTGAALMTCESALRAGAGLVTLATTHRTRELIEARVLEVMSESLTDPGVDAYDDASFERARSLLAGKNAVAFGPGVSAAEGVRRLLLRLLRESLVPLVIDADGITVLDGHLDALREARGGVVLTPHPGEMARIAGLSAAEVQLDRPGVAGRFAREYGVHLVLKGARTVIAHPDGALEINPTGNPGMASAGMGDVLTGVIAGLIAQGITPREAAFMGPYIHGAAADLAAGRRGRMGLLATDVTASVAELLASWGR